MTRTHGGTQEPRATIPGVSGQGGCHSGLKEEMDGSQRVGGRSPSILKGYPAKPGGANARTGYQNSMAGSEKNWAGRVHNRGKQEAGCALEYTA